MNASVGLKKRYMYKVVYYLFPINDLLKLGSVAGPVIQANGRKFEDGLRSEGLLYSV